MAGTLSFKSVGAPISSGSNHVVPIAIEEASFLDVSWDLVVPEADVEFSISFKPSGSDAESVLKDPEMMSSCKMRINGICAGVFHLKWVNPASGYLFSRPTLTVAYNATVQTEKARKEAHKMVAEVLQATQKIAETEKKKQEYVGHGEKLSKTMANLERELQQKDNIIKARDKEIEDLKAKVAACEAAKAKEIASVPEVEEKLRRVKAEYDVWKTDMAAVEAAEAAKKREEEARLAAEAARREVEAQAAELVKKKAEEELRAKKLEEERLAKESLAAEAEEAAKRAKEALAQAMKEAEDASKSAQEAAEKAGQAQTTLL